MAILNDIVHVISSKSVFGCQISAAQFLKLIQVIFIFLFFGFAYKIQDIKKASKELTDFFVFSMQTFPLCILKTFEYPFNLIQNPKAKILLINQIQRIQLQQASSKSSIQKNFFISIKAIHLTNSSINVLIGFAIKKKTI